MGFCPHRSHSTLGLAARGSPWWHRLGNSLPSSRVRWGLLETERPPPTCPHPPGVRAPAWAAREGTGYLPHIPSPSLRPSLAWQVESFSKVFDSVWGCCGVPRPWEAKTPSSAPGTCGRWCPQQLARGTTQIRCSRVGGPETRRSRQPQDRRTRRTRSKAAAIQLGDDGPGPAPSKATEAQRARPLPPPKPRAPTLGPLSLEGRSQCLQTGLASGPCGQHGLIAPRALRARC